MQEGECWDWSMEKEACSRRGAGGGGQGSYLRSGIVSPGACILAHTFSGWPLGPPFISQFTSIYPALTGLEEAHCYIVDGATWQGTGAASRAENGPVPTASQPVRKQGPWAFNNKEPRNATTSECAGGPSASDENWRMRPQTLETRSRGPH